MLDSLLRAVKTQSSLLDWRPQTTGLMTPHRGMPVRRSSSEGDFQGCIPSISFVDDNNNYNYQCNPNEDEDGAMLCLTSLPQPLDLPQPSELPSPLSEFPSLPSPPSPSQQEHGLLDSLLEPEDIQISLSSLTPTYTQALPPINPVSSPKGIDLMLDHQYGIYNPLTTFRYPPSPPPINPIISFDLGNCLLDQTRSEELELELQKEKERELQLQKEKEMKIRRRKEEELQQEKERIQRKEMNELLNMFSDLSLQPPSLEINHSFTSKLNIQLGLYGRSACPTYMSILENIQQERSEHEQVLPPPLPLDETSSLDELNIPNCPSCPDSLLSSECTKPVEESIATIGSDGHAIVPIMEKSLMNGLTTSTTACASRDANELLRIPLLYEVGSTSIYCRQCFYLIRDYSHMVFNCDLCMRSFHAQCIWGQFYMMQADNFRQAMAMKKRLWYCATCLVHKFIQIYDVELKKYVLIVYFGYFGYFDSFTEFHLISRWQDAYVCSYHFGSRQHVIKQFQRIRSISLRHYRVRLCKDMDNQDAHIAHAKSNNSVVEVHQGVRRYRCTEDMNQVEEMDYHSFPQVVCNYEMDSTYLLALFPVLGQARRQYDYQCDFPKVDTMVVIELF